MMKNPSQVLRIASPGILVICGWLGAAAAISQEIATQDPAPVEKRVLAQGELFAPVLDVNIEALLTGLDHPLAVVIRPGGTADRYEIYISESGALRVLRMWSDEPQTASHVVTDFAAATVDYAWPYNVGPLGLLFLDHDRLVVVGTSPEDSSAGETMGRAVVSLFELPDDAEPLRAAQSSLTVRWKAPGTQSESHLRASPVWHAIARTRRNDFVPDLLIVSSHTEGPQGWLHKIRIRAEGLGELESYPRSQGFSSAFPAGLAVSPEGYIVVGRGGDDGDATDSTLSFFNPIDGSLLLSLETGLPDIASLAYSTRSENLYAAALSATAPQTGGIYRIDDVSEPGAPACRAVQVAAVLRPTAMAFGPDGALYVTALGHTDGTATDAGILLRITGGL